MRLIPLLLMICLTLNIEKLSAYPLNKSLICKNINFQEDNTEEYLRTIGFTFNGVGETYRHFFVEREAIGIKSHKIKYKLIGIGYGNYMIEGKYGASYFFNIDRPEMSINGDNIYYCNILPIDNFETLWGQLLENLQNK